MAPASIRKHSLLIFNFVRNLNESPSPNFVYYNTKTVLRAWTRPLFVVQQLHQHQQQQDERKIDHIGSTGTSGWRFAVEDVSMCCLCTPQPRRPELPCTAQAPVRSLQETLHRCRCQCVPNRLRHRAVAAAPRSRPRVRPSESPARSRLRPSTTLFCAAPELP